MKIYNLAFDQRYEQVFFKDKDISNLFIWEFRGNIITNIPENITIETRFHGDPASKGNIYNDGAKMYIPQRTYDILYEFIKDEVQFIEAIHDDFGKCYIINVISLLEDDKVIKCEKPWQSKTGKHNYIFDDGVEFPKIFKIKKDNGISTYVSEEFKNIIDKHELKGLVFYPIWDTELGQDF